MTVNKTENFIWQKQFQSLLSCRQRDHVKAKMQNEKI